MKQMNARIVAMLLALVLAVSACGGSGYDESGASADMAVAEAAAENAAMDDAMESEAMESDTMVDGDVVSASDGELMAEEAAFQDLDDEGNQITEVDTQAPVIRMIIRRGNIHLQVDDVLSSSAEATILVESYGGYVFGQQTSTQDEVRSSITFKVPPEDFQKIMDDLAGLGFLRDQSVTAEDVTGRVVDLESQIRTSETSVERLRTFLSEAKDLATISSLENSLLEREGSLELLRGQLRTLQAQAAQATITAVFTQQVPGPALDLTITAYHGSDAGASCVGEETLVVQEEDLVTLCYRVTNTGDTYLDEISVRDTELRFDDDDIVEVEEGSAENALAPGEHVTFYAEVTATTNRRFARGQATADATDELGNSLDITSISNRGEYDLDVEVDDSLPGFSDGLGGSLGVLAEIGQVLILLAGVVLPFLVFVPFIVFGVRWYRRRVARKPAKTPETPETPETTETPAAPYAPTPPQPPAAPVQE